MLLPEDLTSLGRDDLLALAVGLQEQVVSLQERVANLHDHVERLTTVNEELRQEVANLKRGGERQSVPFSKGTRSVNPKRPGRKPGMGSFSYRKAPPPKEVTEPPVDVAYVTDILAIPQPIVRKYRVQICRCMSCGKKVRGWHPDLAPEQYGASVHQVGKRAMAAAHILHYGVGVPVRKAPVVLGVLTGLELTQGAITQDALRRAHGAVGSVYERLRASVKDSKAVHTDDTGWRVGGDPAFLMAFETNEATVYQARPLHRNERCRRWSPQTMGE